MRTGGITQIRIRNLRTISDLTLDLGGLTVLIGENGVGKSTLLEGLELLRRLAHPQFVEEFFSIHGGFPALLRQGGNSGIQLGLTVDDKQGPLKYDLTLTRDGEHVVVAREDLTLKNDPAKDKPLVIIERTRSQALMFDQARGKPVPIQVPPSAPLLSSFGLHPPQDAIRRMVEALARIRVHTAFDTLPAWQARERRIPSPLRDVQVIEPADELSRYGMNLANAFSALRNDWGEDHWRDTMDYVRLGLGNDVESINVRVHPGGGNIGLRLKYKGGAEQIPAFSLSDGTVAYLAFVALFPTERPLQPARLRRTGNASPSPALDARARVLRDHGYGVPRHIGHALGSPARRSCRSRRGGKARLAGGEPRYAPPAPGSSDAREVADPLSWTR